MADLSKEVMVERNFYRIGIAKRIMTDLINEIMKIDDSASQFS